MRTTATRRTRAERVALPPIASRPGHAHSGRQKAVRRHSVGLPLKSAVRFAAQVFFHFDRRASGRNSLWSAAQRVWMGSETFMHWAILDAEIDIPWLVATAAGLPEDEGQQREAIRRELVDYWTDRIAVLPTGGRPRWLPLP